MHRLLSTAAPPLPAPPVEADLYAEGYAEGYAAGYAAGRANGRAHGRLEELEAVVAWLRAAPAERLWRQEPMDATADALCRGDHLTPAPDPTADKAQLAALGAAARP